MLKFKTTSLSEKEFKEIYDCYSDSIFNFLYYRLKDVALSEDLLQQVFLTLWEKRTSIVKDTVKNYLYTISSNLLKRHIAHQHTVFKFQSSLKDERVLTNPEYLLEAKEFEAHLNRVISAIPADAREAFLMNRIDKLTYNDIAERLDISVKTVEKRMEKALKLIRKSIKTKI